MSLFLVKDVHPLVYFITDIYPPPGSAGYDKMISWCDKMNLDISQIKFIKSHDKNFDAKRLNKSIEFGEVKIVTIGFEAMDFMLELGVDEFFVLPALDSTHKSLARKIEECRAYVHKGVPHNFKENEDNLGEG